MIECIFTVDYEVYGNGAGSLSELVYEPARKLKRVFDKLGAKLVVFVEAAELDAIEAAGTDPAISDVKQQLREFHRDGHEVALHLHPQWANARWRDGQWELDYTEYNLCTLPPERITQIVDRALAWLRSVLDDSRFTPLSFRAGNWLFQPTANAAQVLASRGIQVDSSVFKGGFQSQHRLDYRPALRNGWHWRFRHDVNLPRHDGLLLELPIYTEMVPFWQMLTTKRVTLQRKAGMSSPKTQTGRAHRRICRWRDYARFRYPLKFDFCRMTVRELTDTVQSAMKQDRAQPNVLKPMVAIGHTKDLLDFDTVRSFLAWLRSHGIPVAIFSDVCRKLLPDQPKPCLAGLHEANSLNLRI